MKNLAQALIALSEEVKGLEKDMTVGSQSYGYKGISDKSVKLIIGKAMTKHGLSILPTGVESNITQFDTSKGGINFFTEVKTKYLLLHTSGESVEVVGYGHGVDSQDKGAGKATTYALKYLLIYLSLCPTGHIDDSDTTHSNDVPQANKSVIDLKPKYGDKKVKPTVSRKELEIMFNNKAEFLEKDKLEGAKKIIEEEDESRYDSLYKYLESVQ